MTGMRGFVREFAAARRLTLAGLAAALGYASKTSLTRIMDGKVRAASVRRFEDALRERFTLTRGEEERLSAAVEMKLYGKEISSEDREMWRFLRGTQTDRPRPVIVRDVADGTEKNLVVFPPDVSKIRLTVINCLSMDLSALTEALKRFPDIAIRHYIYAEQSALSAAGLICGVLPLLWYENYEAFSYLRTPGGKPLHGIAAADAIVCEIDRRGEHYERLIFFQNSTRGTGMFWKGEPVFHKLIGIDTDRYEPVKQSFSFAEDADGYVGFLQHCLDMETGRKQLMIKPDLGVELIPASVIGAAICGHGIGEEAVRAMLPLIRRREQANFDRSRPRWIALKRSAMMRFAETGHLANHYWGIRDFTVEERLQIIDRLIQEVQHSEQFHLLFFARDDAVQDFELIQYQGKGLVIIPPHMDSDYLRNYSESTITHEGINAAFQDFFMRQIVRESCLPEGETIGILREMQRVALASGQ